MAKEQKNYRRTKYNKMMVTINKVLYLCGLPHFWVEPVDFSQKFVKIFDVISLILHGMVLIYTALLLGAFITQKNLTKKQQADKLIINCANPISHLYYYVFLYNREKIRDILYTLVIGLKVEYNNEIAEKQVIKKLKMYMSVLLASSAAKLIFLALYGISQMVRSGLPFITVITAWPDVSDVSTKAEVARVFVYCFMWVSILRLSSTFVIFLFMLIGLSQQYKNLQHYFYSLNSIFSENLSQTEKEEKFEKAFIRGVQMHSKTIWCVNQTKHVCRIVLNVQMLVGTGTGVFLLPVFINPDRDVGSVLANIPTALVCLLLTGFFMWNSGDISVEASNLPNAMYSSGWHNCYDSSIRVRRLVVIAMSQAQQPVVLKALGIIELSYDTYLRIIKTSYSVFSVFY